jgi:RNA polymerase sigma-70 factor (ECF subfamily)
MADRPDSRTSTTLLERLQTTPGDPDAWAEFVRRYAPKIRAWCSSWGLQPADVDDVTQAVLTRLVVAIRTFRYDPGQRFRAWLKTVTHHVWLDLAASGRPLGGGAGHDRDILDNLEARTDLERRLAEAFDTERLELAMQRVQQRVAPATWDAFRLTALEGLSGAEAGRRLGMPAAHVFVAKHRVQKLLKEEVQALGDREVVSPRTSAGSRPTDPGPQEGHETPAKPPSEPPAPA